MPKSRFNITVSIVESENDRLQALRKKGHTNISIFRKGIDACEKEDAGNGK